MHKDTKIPSEPMDRNNRGIIVLFKSLMIVCNKTITATCLYEMCQNSPNLLSTMYCHQHRKTFFLHHFPVDSAAAAAHRRRACFTFHPTNTTYSNRVDHCETLFGHPYIYSVVDANPPWTLALCVYFPLQTARTFVCEIRISRRLT